MDWKAKFEDVKLDLKDKWEEFRGYVERNPKKVKKAAPIAAGLLIFLLGVMIIKVSQEVPEPPVAGERGHPLAALEPFSVPPAELARAKAEAEAKAEYRPAMEPTQAEVPQPEVSPAQLAAIDQPQVFHQPEPAKLGSEPNENKSAETTVVSFFQGIDRGDYGTAYRQLSAPWQDSLEYGRFARGYSSTDSIACTVEHVRDFGDGRVRVAVTLDTTEHGVTSRYVGTMLVVREGENWKLDRALQLRI